MFLAIVLWLWKWFALLLSFSPEDDKSINAAVDTDMKTWRTGHTGLSCSCYNFHDYVSCCGTDKRHRAASKFKTQWWLSLIWIQMDVCKYDLKTAAWCCWGLRTLWKLLSLSRVHWVCRVSLWYHSRWEPPLYSLLFLFNMISFFNNILCGFSVTDLWLFWYYYRHKGIIFYQGTQITFNTFLVIFPKEFGMISRTGLVEWLEVLRRFW